jgi:hypothetical protein
MARPTINAREAVKDIRSGMTAEALMKKYGLSPAGLDSLLTKLVKAELLAPSEKDALIPKPPPSPVTAWECPACGAAQPEKPHVCPKCGVIVAKYEKRQAELGGAATAAPAPDRDAGPQPPPSPSKPGVTTRKCPFCSEEIQADATKCKHCGEWLQAPPEVRLEEEAEKEKYCPWEDSERLGAFEAFKQTVAGVLLKPTEFFSRVPPSGGYAKPLLFGIMASSAGIMMAQLWSLLFYKSGEGGAVFTVLMIVLSPVIAVIGLGVGAAVAHLCLFIVGGANESFEATFRANCYAAAPQLWNAVPLAGGVISAVWSLVAVVIGLREIHGTDTGKAILAVLLPVIVCCGLILVGVWFLGMAAWFAM